MPIKKSAVKALRQAKSRAKYNKNIKDNIKWLKRSFLKLVSEKDKKEAETIYLKLQKCLDKAAGRGVIKKNTAARTKSRLYKKLSLLKN